jgi:hypothetical protein
MLTYLYLVLSFTLGSISLLASVYCVSRRYSNPCIRSLCFKFRVLRGHAQYCFSLGILQCMWNYDMPQIHIPLVDPHQAFGDFASSFILALLS